MISGWAVMGCPGTSPSLGMAPGGAGTWLHQVWGLGYHWIQSGITKG